VIQARAAVRPTPLGANTIEDCLLRVLNVWL